MAAYSLFAAARLMKTKRAVKTLPIWSQAMAKRQVVDPVSPAFEKLVAAVTSNMMTDPWTQILEEMTPVL